MSERICIRLNRVEEKHFSAIKATTDAEKFRVLLGSYLVLKDQSPGVLAKVFAADIRSKDRVGKRIAK